MNLLQNVSDFRDHLNWACDYAKTNLKEVQGKMKARYDLQSKDRSFKVGDNVLALLPIPGNPLRARYFGPYTVHQKVSDLNYIILTPGRRKQKQMCHINMLKEYIDRDSSQKTVNVVNTVELESREVECDCNLDNCKPGPVKLENSDILKNLDTKLSHLDSSQQQQLKQLIQEYNHIFPDVPSRTDMIHHDVIIEDNTKPVKQHHYRMNPVKQQYLKEEVQYLLDNDFVEPSHSN